MTKSRLDAPDKECIILMIDTELCDGIRMRDLRDAICHSFVTAEENSNQIIIDDRAKYEKRQPHEKLIDRTMTYTCTENIFLFITLNLLNMLLPHSLVWTT